MPTKKPLKWLGKFRDQTADKYRVWWSSGAWTLSYEGKRISRHGSREQAKRKAGKRPKPKKLTVTATRASRATISKAKASLTRISTQKRHDVAASVARHSNLPATRPDVAAYSDDGPAALFASTGPAGTEPTLVEALPWHASAAEATEAPKLPRPDLPADWDRDLDAMEYEHTRSTEPDPRDNEGQEIAILILTAQAELADECTKVGIKAVLAARDSIGSLQLQHASSEDPMKPRDESFGYVA